MNLIYHWLKNNPGIIIITLVYLIIIVLMLPFRNLAFDDDFAYIQTAEHLYRTGTFKLSEWSATTLIFQTYWGILFAKTFGYSISILIFSNLVLLYFALVSFYLLLKKLVQNEVRSIFFALLLIGFPWVLNYAYSFMSDVFYMSLLIISSYFFVLGLTKKSSYQKLNFKISVYLFLGSLFAGFAFLNRQIGVTIIISAAVVFLYESFVYKKFVWQNFIIILLPALMIIYFYTEWLYITGPTIAQDFALGPKFKEELSMSLWPQKAGHTSITNGFYLQSLQRFLGFLSQWSAFLLPVVLILSFGAKEGLIFIRDNFRVISISFIIISLSYLIDLFNGNRFTESFTANVSCWDIFWGNFYIHSWRFLILISIPILSIILGVTFKFIYLKLLIDAKIKHTKIFIFLIILCLIFVVSHFFIILEQTLVIKPHFTTRLTINTFFTYIQNPDILPTIKEIIQETWLFFIVIIPTSLVLSYLITHKKFSFNQSLNPIAIFIGTLFILELIATIIGGYYYWQNYIIQFIPLIIIWLAYLSNKVKINNLRAILVITFLLFLSLEITRNRYQSQGARWELGTTLINNGVNVINIPTISWAWRPYWLFEDNLQKAIKESGGDKYKIGQRLGGWSNDTTPNHVIDIIEIDPRNLNETRRNNKILGVSEPYWTFKGRLIAVAVER